MGVPEQSQTQSRGANVVQGKYEHLACEHLFVMSILPHTKKKMEYGWGTGVVSEHEHRRPGGIVGTFFL